ncbi:MAG: sensory histidine kinase DcuS [Methanoregula sp. PtaB.Bin085]|nr:MAG: sensory histidine kinase DcuS [Methanoregula sp. PtaB.Bin085]
MKPPRWSEVNQIFLLAISHLDFSRIKHIVKLDGLEIFADPLLERAFQILAGNTITHGGNAKQVSLTCVEMSDGDLKIVYQDDGQGIAENVKREIFSRDFLHKKGLDLYLAREILEITGMSIVENGVQGEGARFEITVPKGAWRFTGKKE